jgi:predicted ATP-grasp superfamily ATP-dependent carboligase
MKRVKFIVEVNETVTTRYIYEVRATDENEAKELALNNNNKYTRMIAGYNAGTSGPKIHTVERKRRKTNNE